MKIAVFGGTGFVGSYIIDELLNNGHEPVVLVRKGSESKLSNSEKCEIVLGDLSNIESIESTIKGTDAVIYCVGIIREFPSKGVTFEKLHFQGAKECIDTASAMNVKRFIMMSANGVKVDGTGYQKTKYLAEEYLKFTNLDWTIFQPSLIFGDPRGEGRPEFCSQLKKDMLSLPFPAPNFHAGLNPMNAGKFAMSPIHVKDVAQFFVKSIELKESVKKTFALGGEAYYWKDIVTTIAKSYGKKKWMVPAPALGIQALATFLGRFSWFPITKDQITMLIEGNICESKEFYNSFKIEQTPFNTETLSYLNS